MARFPVAAAALALAALVAACAGVGTSRGRDPIGDALRRAEAAAARAEQAAARAEAAADRTTRRRCEVAALSIDAQAGWVDTQLDVAESDAVTITQAGGAWTVDRRSYEPVDADGHLDEQRLPLWDWRHLKTMRTAPFGCLLASVGDRRDPIVVGRSRHLVAPRPGRLELRINDEDEALGDNGGAVIVRVRIQNRSDCP